jgi:hypothetical protein
MTLGIDPESLFDSKRLNTQHITLENQHWRLCLSDRIIQTYSLREREREREIVSYMFVRFASFPMSADNSPVSSLFESCLSTQITHKKMLSFLFKKRMQQIFTDTTLMRRLCTCSYKFSKDKMFHRL